MDHENGNEHLVGPREKSQETGKNRGKTPFFLLVLLNLGAKQLQFTLFFFTNSQESEKNRSKTPFFLLVLLNLRAKQWHFTLFFFTKLVNPQI